MKRTVYYAIIGIGVVLFILGIIPSVNIGWFWGFLISAVAAVALIVNIRNEKQVAARLQEERDMFRRNQAESENTEEDSSEAKQ